MTGRVLIVDDDRDLAETIEAGLTRRGYEVVWFDNAEAALEEARRRELDVVLTDLRMPGMTGIELCRRMAESRPDVPVVVLTAFGNLESAVAAIRAGAYDFVVKPIEFDSLALTLERAVKHRDLLEKVKVLTEEVERSRPFEDLLGESPAMKALYGQMARISDSDASVLIIGESGTGKELVAKALHARGPRRDGPFVAINCAALPPTLLESELFGHRKGAFTNAAESRKGVFLEAHGGTLFLDEIGDLPLELQPKLLRAIEERSVRPVGGDREIPIDVRLIAATNRDIESEVDEKRFREDLYFRINVITLELPPLRARGADVLLLARSFVERFAPRSGKDVSGISAPAAEKLLAYDWRGNVRELRNAMERAVALTRYDQIAVEDLPEKIRSYESRSFRVVGADPEDLLSMEEVERRYIRYVLDTVEGNKTLAARVLGLDRKTLYRKLARPDE